MCPNLAQILEFATYSRPLRGGWDSRWHGVEGGTPGGPIIPVPAALYAPSYRPYWLSDHTASYSFAQYWPCYRTMMLVCWPTSDNLVRDASGWQPQDLHNYDEIRNWGRFGLSPLVPPLSLLLYVTMLTHNFFVFKTL